MTAAASILTPTSIQHRTTEYSLLINQQVVRLNRKADAIQISATMKNQSLHPGGGMVLAIRIP